MVKIAPLAALIVVFLLNSFTAHAVEMTISYWLRINNSEEEINCDTFSIDKGKGLCREGGTLYVYLLNDVQSIRVFNGTKSYTFSRVEMLEDEERLASALNVLNKQKQREMAEAKMKYDAKMKKYKKSGPVVNRPGNYPEAANGSEYEQNMINEIQIKIQQYKSSNLSVGRRAIFVSELEIEKSTIIARSDSQQAIRNLESTEHYIKSLNMSPGRGRKLLDFVRKAKIVLLRRGVPNSTFPGFNY